jgi:hypothetical protein
MLMKDCRGSKKLNNVTERIEMIMNFGILGESF